MKLTIELVPSTSWYTNVRSMVDKAQWDVIRKNCYKHAHYKCEICRDTGFNQNAKWPVECHEIWEYDDIKHTQTLTGFIALCPNCHKVKHVGLSEIKGWMDIVHAQLIKVNDMSEVEVAEYIGQSFLKWEERSQHEWKININYIKKYYAKSN